MMRSREQEASHARERSSRMAVRLAALMICLLLTPVPLAAQDRTAADSVAAGSTERIEELERRIRDLEQARAAHEEATRSIIRQTIDQSTSRINNVASFGGVFEVLAGRTKDFTQVWEPVMKLNGIEFVFEVQTSEWTLGNFVLQYADGQDQLFATTIGTSAGVPRFDIDTGYLTLGNTQKFPLYSTLGRIILPFGISTGDPVTDVPTISNPLTVEGFEMREDAFLIGVGLPTPPTTPTVSVLAAPAVKPKALRPLFGGLARLLGYRPPAPVPTEPAVVEPASPPPPLTLGFLWYRGNTVAEKNPSGSWYPGLHYGATAGFRTTGTTAIDFNVDYNSSIFDAEFFESEYSGFLDEIGLVPGMAASLKAKMGPVGLVTEWNGAVKQATFQDDLDRFHTISPRAWQVGMIYQLGWNSGVEALGAQGTYVAVDYSRTLDFAGAAAIPVSETLRIGALPEERLLLSVGEWVLDGVRVQLEYSHIKDYRTSLNGTGRTAQAWFGMITYDW